MSAFPHSRGVFIRFGEGRIDMNRTENLVQTDTVLHRENEFGDQVAGMFPCDRNPEDFILSGNGQDFYKTLSFAVRDCPAQLGQIVEAGFIRDALFLCLLFVQPDRLRER